MSYTYQSVDDRGNKATLARSAVRVSTYYLIAYDRESNQAIAVDLPDAEARRLVHALAADLGLVVDEVSPGQPT